MRPPRMGAPMIPTKEIARFCHGIPPRGADQPRTISNSDSAKINRLTVHTDQAIQAAVRWLIPPTPSPCFPALAVTTPLYSTTVSKALRNALRGSNLQRKFPMVLSLFAPNHSGDVSTAYINASSTLGALSVSFALK